MEIVQPKQEDKGETRGRKPINEVTMTNSERQQKHLSNPLNYEKHLLRVREYSRRKRLSK